jgi:tRNA threonylcarbamoyladenosine biosynthesis protein TsaE
MALDDTYIITTESDMEKFAQILGQEILDTASGPKIIGLSGDLGVGKTTLVQFLGKFLGVTEHMTSPTYVIMKKYNIEKENFSTFVHMDTYRILDSDEDLFGFKEVIQDARAVICIEWPEKISQFLTRIPMTMIDIHLGYTDNNPVRTITIKNIL